MAAAAATNPVRAMTRAPPIVVGDGSPPPPVDCGSDSDSDNYSLQAPQFVIHTVDDDRRRLPPAPAAAILPIQNRAPAVEEQADREAARMERLRFFLILPQVILCGCVVDLGIVMICLANTAEARANLVWVFLCSALVIFFSLVSLLLSYLAVYHYDGWPCLDRWLDSPPRHDNYNVPMYY